MAVHATKETSMLTLKMRGRICEAETGLGLGGLLVKAYDQDLFFDDLLGNAMSDGSGRFEIITELEDFRDLFEKCPDLYFKVMSADGTQILHRTPTAWSLKQLHLDQIEIHIPREQLGGQAPAQRFILVGAADSAPRESFDPGEPLAVAATGVRPGTPHEVVVRDATGKELFTDRLISDAEGRIEETVIWAQLGLDDPRGGSPLTVEEARQKWGGHTLAVELREGGRVLGTSRVRIAEVFERPLVLATDARGVIVNGFEVGQGDAIVSIYSLPSEGIEGVRVYMVPRQHDWRVGDAIRPVVLEGGGKAVVDVELQRGQRDVRVTLAHARELRPGAYDFLIRPLRSGYEDDHLVLLPTDIVGTRRITGLVVREHFMPSKAVRGGCVNTLQIAGRTINESPYFQFTNVFQVGENIHGALNLPDERRMVEREARQRCSSE
jgi:hypothetical protein